MVVIYTFGHIFRVLKLPVIFGELLGGIILGPLVLNIIDPESDIIKIFAELGIFFLMLHAGLENNPKDLLKSSKKSILISIGGMIIPLVGGFFVSQIFIDDAMSSFFIGVALSITALPIALRIFKDCNIQSTQIAKITVASALINDIVGLILLSVVISVAESGFIDFASLGVFIAKVIFFFLAVIVLGIKSAKYIDRILKNKGFTFALIVALILGLLAEAIGLHMIIGAFLAGLFIREEVVNEKVFRKIEDRVYGLSYSFLGPIFFTSLAFHLSFENVMKNPLFLIAIILIAIIGKIFGAGMMAFFQGMNLKQSGIIGLAMNTRGAVELIIADIGLKQGIISEEIFSILVIMAFATTFFSIIGMRIYGKHAE